MTRIGQRSQISARPCQFGCSDLNPIRLSLAEKNFVAAEANILILDIIGRGLLPT
jgi:hypothetical protein